MEKMNDINKNKQNDKILLEETEAFNKRINERIAAGFIPDLRQAVKCDYFYKSFWRDPHFIKLYLGKTVETFVELLETYGGNNLTILDVGCGAGYVSLELARVGHHVTGIDIADQAIKAAENTLAHNPFRDNFGSLQYQVLPFEKAVGNYDVVLFSGTLHHFRDIHNAIQKSTEILKPNGLILCHEPSHDIWRPEDAAQVALIRGLLCLTGYWYESDLENENLKNKGEMEQFIQDIYLEYVMERDKTEGGQSPEDNATSGMEILKELCNNYYELEYRNGASFIYRLLGGLRGENETIYKIADFIALYEEITVEKGYLKPNNYFFIGRKKSKETISSSPLEKISLRKNL